MLLQILSLALCVLVTAAVDCPDQRAMTSEMRDSLLESYTNVQYSCDLEKMVYSDFARCVDSRERHGGPEILKIVEDWTDEDDPNKHVTLIRERWARVMKRKIPAEIGCAHEKNQCEDLREAKPYLTRCFIREFDGEADGSIDDETAEEKKAAEQAAEIADRNMETTTSDAPMTSSYGVVIFIVSLLI